MDVRILRYFIFVIVGLTHIEADEPCQINLSSLMFRPFVLTSEGNFFPTQNNIVVINSGNNASVSCQKFKFEKFPKVSTIKVTCDNGKLMSDSAIIVQPEDLHCELKIIDVKKCNVQKCTETNIGLCYFYYNTDKSANVRLAEVCFDRKISRINFVKVYPTRDTIISEKLIDFDEKISIYRNLFGISNDNILDNLIGENRNLSYDYIRIEKIIPKGLQNEQLQDVEQFPLNNVGLWNSVVEGNWRRLTEDIRNFKSATGDSVELIFGTHQSLVSHDGEIIYFVKNRETIPQFVWAIVYDSKSDYGLAIVTLNDPFASFKQLKSQVFCKSICEDIPWLKNLMINDNHNRPAMGYTFCCKLKDFQHIYLH